jgi:transcriptional regulator with XRE-family HTH domain
MLIRVSNQNVSNRQIKAARALIGWSQEHLTAASGVSLPTIKRLESADGLLGGRQATRDRLIAALADAGVIFIDSDEEGPGVRLRLMSVLETGRMSTPSAQR